MRFSTWKVRGLYSLHSLTTAARELSMNKLDLLCVQRVGWYKGVTVSADNYIFSTGKEIKINNWEQIVSYTTDYCQQLRQQSLSVTGCHIYE